MDTPLSKRLITDKDTNLLIYLTGSPKSYDGIGHGGDGFLKFQDAHEITAKELADVISHMYVHRRFKSILLIIDTCQAQSMAHFISAPEVISITSSKVGESSYSVCYILL